MSAALPNLSPAMTGLRRQITQRWGALAPRERYALGAALFVFIAFVAWLALIQPAWRSVRAAPVLLDQLDTQLQEIQRLASETRELRAAPPVSAGQAADALKAATGRLGETGKIALRGDRAVLTLNNASSEGLRAWLNEARSAARARPVELQLQRSPQGYSGSITVSLPGSP
jgi:general secretion pathway protein M